MAHGKKQQAVVVRLPGLGAPLLGITVSELAQRSGVSVSTIKYYLREGLLPHGDLSAKKRQYYGQKHLDRLSMIRALREVAQLPIETVKQLVLVLERGRVPTLELVATAIDALGRHRDTRESSSERRVAQQLSEFLKSRGLRVRATSGALRDLAVAVSVLRRFSPSLEVAQLTPYVDYALALAEHEVGANAQKILTDPESALTTGVLGTVLWEPLILATRRLASEHVATQVFESGSLSGRSRPQPALKAAVARSRRTRKPGQLQLEAASRRAPHK